MKASSTPLAKYFVAVLYSESAAFDTALAECEDLFGPVDYQSERFPFSVTDYYENEMGPNLVRQFMSFEKLAEAGELGKFKALTNTIETTLAQNDKRVVNLDIGYLDFDKVVLASAKYNWQKIYISDGFYADLTLYYRKGSWHSFEWSFPDFKLPTYYSALVEIRNRYKNQMKYR